MATRFQCPNCKAIRAANPRLLGREIQCPQCGQAVQLPTQEQMEESRRRQQRLRREERQRELQFRRILAQAPVATVAPEWDVDEPPQLSAEEQALVAAEVSFVRPLPPARQDMDMTPMVDVTFLLLIFFMITASFSVQKSIQRPAQRQEEPSTNAVEIVPDENPDVVTVQVDEFNAYNIITSEWDRVVGSKQDLIIGLHDAHSKAAGRPPSKLVVQAHEDCIHAAVVAALDAGREAQFESFEVSTVEQFD
ncbi:MAG: biopolymer transporter ExbD [Planctomycetales bacterium]|nr:biopolymer transporter ExbD [Planctomycetales bacterium]